MTKSARRWLFLLGTCLLAAGCGRQEYEGPQRFPISGTVTVDGELMDYGMISFIPLGSHDEQRVSGGPIVDGEFSVKEAKGPNAGKYRVEIRWQKSTGRMVREPDSGEVYDARIEGLPDRFHKDSELTAEVSEEQTVFDFNLKLE